MRAAVYKGNKKFIIEERFEKEPSNDEVRLKITFYWDLPELMFMYIVE